MSYLTNYEDDIFISYAHRDNEPLLEGQRGWIDNFHALLERRLRQLLGAEPAIWRDLRLHGNEYFADTLIEQIPKVAILISILSPSYINSTWCQRERSLFLQVAKRTGGVRIGNKARIFRVEKTFVPREQYPPELQDTLGYPFYYTDSKGRHLELNLEVASREDQIKYLQILEDVALEITELLKTLRSSNGRPNQEILNQQAATSTARRVYLAETTSDLREQRSAIARELQRRGNIILPDKDLPLVEPEFEAAVRECLSRSALSVHLVGSRYGLIPEEADRSVVCLQNDLAAERSATGELTHLIWIPPGLPSEVMESRQREYIERLRNDGRILASAELVEEPFENFKTIIQDKLSALTATVRPSKDELEQSPSHIYLICEKEDFKTVTPLKDYLFELGFEVTRSLSEGDEEALQKDHLNNLLTCDAVLIYYGKSADPEGDTWLREKLTELRKIRGYGRSSPMLAKAIYLDALERVGQNYRTREALIIRSNARQIVPEALQEFVTQLKGADRGRANGHR
jgi:hypothetical protein